MTVKNDAAGMLVFSVPIGNQTDLNRFGVDIFIDTDQDESTGPDFRGAGTEVFMRLATQNGNGTFVWNGSQLAQETLDSYSAEFSGGVATFHINIRDLGGSRAFDFVVETLTIVPGGQPGVTDYAPETQGVYTYEVKGVPTVTAGAPQDGAEDGEGGEDVRRVAPRDRERDR